MTPKARFLKAKRGKDSIESAHGAGLRYVSDEMPGIRREKQGDGFCYRFPTGDVVREQEVLRRIKSLVIPPAWSEVWICPDPKGHLQATGRDTRGRKQNRYHPDWRKIRDETKYGRMMAFAKLLPKIRKRVLKDLHLKGLPRDKVLAAVVRLLEVSLIRVGNEEYARENESFGLTTMQDRHVDVTGATLRFRFKGKSGKSHDVDIRDARLAKIVKNCQDLPGQDLFQYVDEHGKRQDVDSNDVNEYLREITGQGFTAKDFRTWAGTVLGAMALREFERFDSQAQAKKNILRAIDANPDIPPLSQYPRSHQVSLRSSAFQYQRSLADSPKVTYRYYIGMIDFLNENHGKVCATCCSTRGFGDMSLQGRRNKS